MKTFIFLDVDQTILYDNENVNEALIDALVAHGITDVYLFTNMDMKEIMRIGREGTNMSRFELIERMKLKGLNIHGVITPADPSYYDNDGKLHPVGTAYENLYNPSYQRLKTNPLRDSNGRINPARDIDSEADYYLKKAEWDKASHITRKRCEARGVEEIDIPQLILFDGAIETVCPDKATLVNELSRHHSSQTEYEIRFSQTHTNGKMKIKIDYTDNKALMMDVAIRELTKKHGDIAILFADDRQEHLEGAEEAVKCFNDENNNTLVSLETLKMQTQFRLSINDSANYNAAINQFKLKLKAHRLFETRRIEWLSKWDTLQIAPETTEHRSENAQKVLALLADYAGINNLPIPNGLFRLFTGHTRRHYCSEIASVIARYNSVHQPVVDDILVSLKNEMADASINIYGDLSAILRVVKEKINVNYTELKSTNSAVAAL